MQLRPHGPWLEQRPQGGGAGVVQFEPLAGLRYRVTGAQRCRKQGGTLFGQLALRSLVSAPDHAPGCPKLRTAPRPISRLGRAGRPTRPCFYTSAQPLVPRP